ncbi:MAG: XRE family transcriptional regulator [Chitinophagaceae bacterium]
MQKTNHRMIQLARESRGLSQTELAEKLQIPQGNLSRMERGDIGVKDSHLKKMSDILGYPEDFFSRTNQICTSDTHYRRAITIDQKTKLRSEAIMNIYKFNIEEMLKSLDVRNNVPTVNDHIDSPAKIAQYLRSYWKVAKGPIDNLTSLVEKNGIIVVPIDFETDKIDGRTIVTDTGHPVIFLNKALSGDRERLTLAHELGHVVMHINRIPTFMRDEESEAFLFASEFLMPFNECQFDLTDKLSMETLANLKRVWKISMQSILYRAQAQELVNKNRCRYLWSIFNAKGWKKKEPIEIPKDKTTLIDKMVKTLIEHLEYSKEDISKLFALSKIETEARYFTPSAKLRVA